MTQITIRGWHRTNQENAEGILREGFNLKRRNNGRAWGDGTYLALHPDTLEIYYGDTLVIVEVQVDTSRVAFIPNKKTHATWYDEAAEVARRLQADEIDAAVIEANPGAWGPGGYQVVAKPQLVKPVRVHEYYNYTPMLQDLAIPSWKQQLRVEGLL